MELNVHVLAGLAVASRVADVWTTYLVTPTLKIEANLLARRLGWPYAILTILAGLLTYVSEPLGVTLFSMSFLVAASNASKILLARAIGEEELAALGRRVFLATPPWPGLLFMILPGICIGVIGTFLCLFEREWVGYYVGYGMLALALAVFVWFPARYFRVRADAVAKDG